MSKKKCFVDEVMDYREHFIDIAMLDRFTAYCRKRLVDYARMLQAIHKDACIVDGRKSRHAREKDIDEIANALINDNYYQVNADEYEVVAQFLETLRGEFDHKPIKSQCELKVEYSNAHEFVLGVINYAVSYWRELSAKYRFSSIFISRMYDMQLGSSLPRPVKLYALLAAEYAKAREILLAQPEVSQ